MSTNSCTSPIPVEAIVRAKNSMMLTTAVLANAVLILLEICRTVNMRMPLKYGLFVLVRIATANPATDQKNKNVPTTMSAAAKSPWMHKKSRIVAFFSQGGEGGACLSGF